MQNISVVVRRREGKGTEACFIGGEDKDIRTTPPGGGGEEMLGYGYGGFF